jgi:hypothetical protein
MPAGPGTTTSRETENYAPHELFPYLRIFLEEKFLAWLEVVSAVGAVGGAVVALERLTLWLEVCF